MFDERSSDLVAELITQWINGAAGASRILDMTMIGITRFGVPVIAPLGLRLPHGR